MKLILRSALATALLAGATALVPGAASAGVNVSVGIGVPGPAPLVVVSPYDEQYYYEPIYIGGYWYHGPYRWRMRHGERVFFVDGRWRRNEWSGGPMPLSIEFRNGGTFRGGRYEGFGDADRINARFHSGNNDMHEDRRELKTDKVDLKNDHGDVREDRKDLRHDRKDDGHDGDRRDGDRHDGDKNN
jgi:hypothetical protein